MEPKEINEYLTHYVKLQTSPVAVKMLSSKDDIPERALTWKKTTERLIPCQAVAIARRVGMNIALTMEDIQCPTAILVLGFRKPPESYLRGTLAVGTYVADDQAGRRSEELVIRLPHKKYQAILVAPLHRTDFVPDLILTYGTPAQVMRLIHGSLYKNGGNLISSTGARFACSEMIARTMVTGECQYIVPCMGERAWGLVQDHEMAFSIPWERSQEVAEGLEKTHKAGLRYPIMYHNWFEPIYPLKYLSLREELQMQD